MSRQENTKSIIVTLPEVIEKDKSFERRLKDSQLRVLDTYMSDAEKHQKGIFNLATGFGKTRMMSVLMESYLRSNPNGRVVVVVPTTDLIEDATGGGVLKSFKEYHGLFKDLPPLNIGAYYSYSKNADGQITVTTYNSLKNLQQMMPAEDVGLLLLDEAHHGISDARTETIKKFENAAQYGMTATPWYDERRDLRNALGDIIASVSISDAIKEDDLAGCTNILLISNLSVDLTKVERSEYDGDYDEDDYYKALVKAVAGRESDVNKEGWVEAHKMISRNVAQFYEGMFNGQKCMINCRSQKEALIQANELNEYFGKTVAKTYTTDYSDPKILEEFVKGDLPIICQVGKLSEGFDFPGLYYCINYPNCSWVKEAQLGGRCLRKYDKDPYKEAIVVDIAFKHPDYENPIDAIRQNGQVLFMDILGAPVVKPVKEFDKDKDGKDRAPRTVVDKPDIKLPDFHIISDTQELISIMNEADKIKEGRGIPLISEGMLAEEEFCEHYGLSRAWGLDLLVKAKAKTYLDPETNEEKDFVTCVDTGHGVRLALTNDPVGIKLFEEENKKILFAPEIKPGMSTARDLVYKYKISRDKANKLLEEEWKDIKYPNSKTKQKEQMVYFVKNKGVPCYALTNDPEGIAIFEENEEFFVPQIRKGQLGLCEFEYKYCLYPAEARKILNELAYQTFYDPISNTDKDFCDRVMSGTHKIWVLTDNPVGIKEFEKKYRKEIALPVVPGMLNAKQLSEKYGLSEKICKRILEDLRDETFHTPEGEEELLVAPVYDPKDKSRRRFLALTADPEGQKLFEKLKGDILFAQEIQPGMLTIADVKEKYAQGTQKGLFITLPRLQELFDKYDGKIYLDPETKEEKKFIITVKKDKEIVQVLTNDPVGAKLFEEENKNFLKATYNWGGWQTDYGLSRTYRIPQDVAQKLLEENEGRTFVVPGLNEPQLLVTSVYFPPKMGCKSRLCLALTPYKEGRKIFEEENKEILAQKEKAVYSPTLRPRLAVASNQPQPAITHKPNTPEM